MLAAVILSAGTSTRSGSPRALLPYQGRPFLEHLLEITAHPKIGARRVVLGGDAGPIARAIHLKAEEIVTNEDSDGGQMRSFQAALRTLSAGTDGVLLCLIDRPLVSATLVDELIEKFYFTHKSIVLPVHEGRRGHPVIFGADLYDELLRAPAAADTHGVISTHAADVYELLTNEEGCILNLNDPDALEKIR
jgi:molybdenum cofactor cytidylyltransferase